MVTAWIIDTYSFTTEYSRRRTPRLAMHSLPIITLSRSSWLSGLSGSMARNRTARPCVPPLLILLLWNISPLLLMLYFSYSSTTLNSHQSWLSREVYRGYTQTQMIKARRDANTARWL